MKIEIEASKFETEIDGVPVHYWQGVTQDGTPCKVFVHLLKEKNEYDRERFEKELSARMPPTSKLPSSYLLD